MHLSGKTRARLRRAALSPRMVGLVTFSLSLLVLGVIAYTASLPSLIQASRRSEERSLSARVAKGLFGAVDADADGAGDGTGAQGDEAADVAAGVPEGGEAAERPKKGANLGGLTIQGVISGVAGGSSGAGSAAPGSGSTGAPSGGAAGTGGSGNPSGGGPGAGPAAPGESTPQEVPGEPSVTEEQEQQFYNALLAKANQLSGYVGEVNAATSAFNGDCMADAATRQRHWGEASGLMERLLGEYLYVRDSILVTNDSRYKDAQGDLIRMYRLLMEYMSEVSDAWARNVGETPGDVNSLIAKIQAAQNNQLAEFQQVYNGFAL